MLGATVKDVPSRRAHTKCVPSGTEAVAEKRNTTPPKSLPGLRIEAGSHEILYTMNVDSTVFMLPMHVSHFVFTNELLKFYLVTVGLGYVVLVPLIFGRMFSETKLLNMPQRPVYRLDQSFIVRNDLVAFRTFHTARWRLSTPV